MLLAKDNHTSADAYACLYFHCAFGFDTQLLAYMLDSLVRVSRRVEEGPVVRIANMRVAHSRQQLAASEHSFALLQRRFAGPAGPCSILSPMGPQSSAS